MTRHLRSIFLLLMLAASCGHPAVSGPLPAPNPNGCYVMVFDRPQFRGTRDLWNGPGRWSTLEGLRQTRPDGWRNQIRSLRVGTGAIVTVFTDAAFRGASRQFAADTAHQRLGEPFSGRIESLELSCR